MTETRRIAAMRQAVEWGDQARALPEITSPALEMVVEMTRGALALPDDPRDAKIRAFAASMTPEKWQLLTRILGRLHCVNPGCAKPQCVDIREILASVEALQS